MTLTSESMTNLHPVPSDDFRTMDNDALAAAVSTLAAHIHAATYRLLALIAELDRREVWSAQGALSCAHWLSWACGIDTHTAREKVRVARALSDLPLLCEALAKGELGYSKGRALTRIADGRAGRCEIEHRTAIAAETARRLCCDAGIVPVVDGPNGEPLSVGRRTRSIPPSVRRALLSRDRGCRFPGCTATHRLHGHHVKHWADGGETSLDNLILLCPTHHRLVHEGGFDVQRLDDGMFRFTNPHGLAIRPPRRREASSPDTIIVQNESLGLAIDCETATAHWHGECIDYDHALMVTMASWDSGDTTPEAGPAAGDWNPS